MGHQRRRRRLAVRTGDRDAARAGLQRRERAEAEIELRDDLDAGMPCRGQHRRIGRHARGHDHPRGVADLVEIVAADLDVHPRHAFEGLGGFAGIRMIGRVARVDPHALAREQPGRRNATLAEADDRDDAAGAAPIVWDQPAASLLDHRTLSVASAIIALNTPRM